MCYLGYIKIIEGSIFWSRYWSQKLLSDLDLGGPGDLRSDLWGHPRSIIVKIVILPSLKDNQFFILQHPHLRSFKAVTSIRPPRPFEVTTSNPTSEAIWGRDLKIRPLSLSEAVWGRSLESDLQGGDTSERSELTAGGPASSRRRLYPYNM